MNKITREQWDKHWKDAISRYHFKLGLSFMRSRQLAYEETEKTYGPRPAAPPDVGLPGRVLLLFGRLMMPAGVKAFVNKWGVLLSVIYLALSGLLKALASSGVEWAAPVAAVLSTLFGLLGLDPLDPNLATNVTVGVGSAWALYGASRKVASEVKKARS